MWIARLALAALAAALSVYAFVDADHRSPSAAPYAGAPTAAIPVFGGIPVDFTLSTLADINNPTAVAFGPDERLYVGTRTGDIYALTFDDDYNVTDTQLIETIDGNSNDEILGVSFNPHDPPDPVRLYVSHNELYANGGSCFNGFSPYSGQVSVLTGPDFDVIEPLITGLPVSNHDHGINGTDFDNNGDMYVCVGGNTNAGVAGDCSIGEIPESPLSGSIIRAELSKPGFNGTIVYHEIGTATSNDDQSDGDIVELAPGIDITVHAPGMRNSYDLVFTSWGMMYATDNGPNGGFGEASTGPDTEDPDPSHPDELCLIEYGRYYGHPNRNRANAGDPRQYIYRDEVELTQPGEFEQAIDIFSSSTNGIVEYRSHVFGGNMLGDLIAQKHNGATYRVELSADNRSVDNQSNLDVSMGSLDIATGPGGVIFGAAYSPDEARIATPNVGGGPQLAAYDVFPWRAPATGGHPFVIAGANFGTLGDTTVTFGGIAATLTSVSSTRIRGTVPASSTPSIEMLDIGVDTGGQQTTLPEAFRYLLPVGSEPTGWKIGPDLSTDLGEVAAAIVDDVLYVFGEGDGATLAYDIDAGTWTNPGDLAERQFTGHHHTAVVIDGRIYVFGGLGHSSQGEVQIYDPVADEWSAGADMPWNGGSCIAAMIGDLVYVCGGIEGSSTVTDLHAYDPDTDSWSPALADMIDGRNHAAAATDGERLYVFGGRGPGSGNGNTVANGFADVQIYDPVTDTWESSEDPGSTIAPLPQARGGTGVAVYAHGEFYVMGGETDDGPGAGPLDTYDRVDVYDPVANTWRLEEPMPVPLHGHWPVLWDNRLWVGGGGIQAGNSQSTNFMIFDLPPDLGLVGDVNGDGAVDTIDFLQLLGAWGDCNGCPEDLNGDGTVDTVDFLTLLANWTTP